MQIDDIQLVETAFIDLRDLFREGSIIATPQEREKIEECLKPLFKVWNTRFPDFPPRVDTSPTFRELMRRCVRDAYLKQLISDTLISAVNLFRERIIVNPVAVFGRHARDLARMLPDYQVIASDIFAGSNASYPLLWWQRSPKNYRFLKDDIFAPKLDVRPIAVVFFGACGSLTDAALDYAIRTETPYVLCRTCCHDNIAGNTHIHKRSTALNRAYRWKNINYRLAQKVLTGHYFNPAYDADHYPTSQCAQKHSTGSEFLEFSRHATDSELCRLLIDLDRILHLLESGYKVWYRDEVMVAIR